MRPTRMQAYTFLHWLEPALGASLMAVALSDLFLTVLYARAGAGFVSDRVASITWAVCYRIAKAFGDKRATVLSFSGSFIVVALVMVWAGLLTVGSALIIHPYLGTSVRSSDNTTDTNFMTALYAGGSSMSLVGASDYSAKTTAFRLVYLFNSLVGMSVMSLALTYIMQIYNALQSRNTFGLTLHFMTGRTGDAAALIRAIGPREEFSAGYTNLGQMADAISATREAHDFYPVLFYFRFPEARYSASRTTLVALDTVSLIRAAIPDGKNGWIKNAASVTQLWEASISLLRTLEETFLPGSSSNAQVTPTEVERETWRQRYVKAAAELRAAGIETVASEDQGADAYIGMRSCWNHYITDLANYMAWPMDKIDTATPDVNSRRA